MSQDSRHHLKHQFDLLLADRKSSLDRFTAEVEFARRLAQIEGEKADGWEELIQRAEKTVQDAIIGSGLDGVREAVHQAEEILAPIAKVAKTHTLHCVGHGHIDMNWMWSWPETVAVTNDTFLTVLRLMDEFPDFRYTQSQAAVYEIARVHHPELFERIKEKIREGRWEVAASHWVEGDKNIASGESLTRHLLYTRQYMKEHLGLEAEDVTVDWSPDTFGHAWTIPSVDARGGVRHYYCCRSGDEDNPLLFWWEGPDGARILVNKELHWYNGTVEPGSALDLMDFRKKTGLRDRMHVYGVGDHGGGPTRRDVRQVIEMNTWPVFPNYRFATTREYYDLLEQHADELPVIRRELNFEFAGCYTSQSEIKKANRFGENAAVEAEVAAVRALVTTGRPYPAETLRDAWTDVLFNHFHDILPGSGVPETRIYSLGLFQKVMAATGLVKTNSLRAVAGLIDTSFAQCDCDPGIPAALEPIAMGGGAGRGTALSGISVAGHTVAGARPVVVFNPTAWPRNEVVRVTIWDARHPLETRPFDQQTFVVRGPDGSVMPAQKVGSGDYWGHQFVELAFPARVAALGHATYALEEGTVEAGTPGVTMAVESEGKDHVNRPSGRFTMENAALKVEFDRGTGGIASLIDKRTGRDLARADAPMGVLEYALERPQGGSAWIVSSHQEEYSTLAVEWFGAGEPGGWHSHTDHAGPHVAQATARVRVKDSVFKVTYRLKADEPMLEILVEGRWLERGGQEIGTPRLAMRFPANLNNAVIRHEIPFGSITRDDPNGREVPALRWADIVDKNTGAGVAVLNDCKYSHAVKDSALHITVLRATYNPDPLPEIGDHSMRFAIVPHSEELTVAELTCLGTAFNHPLECVNTDAHEGSLPAISGDLVRTSDPGVIVTHVKREETGEGLVFRLQETSGKDTDVTVTLDSNLLVIAKEAVEVDVLERPVEAGRAKAVDGGFRVAVPALGIASVRVTF